LPQSLAQWPTADAILGRQLRFDQPLSRYEAPSIDGIPNMRGQTIIAPIIGRLHLQWTGVSNHGLFLHQFSLPAAEAIDNDNFVLQFYTTKIRKPRV
jgi:hypothetical protein